MTMAFHVLGLARTLPFHSIGGLQSIGWDLFSEFVRSGVRVTLLTTEIPGRRGPFEEQGVQVVPIRGAAPERYSRQWWKGSAAYVRDEMRDPVDGVLSVSAAAAGLLDLRPGILRAPFLFQAHGTSWGEVVSKWRSGRITQWAKSSRNLLWMFKDAQLYRQFDHLVLVGDIIEEQFHSFPLNLMAGSIPRTVIRNGIDTRIFAANEERRREQRAALSWPQQAEVAVFIGRLHPQKGGIRAIEVFADYARVAPQARLLIVGGGEEEEALRAKAAGSGLAARIHFTGPVSRDRVPSLLAACDAMIFPTLRQEGLPMNVLEALACGVYPICSSTLRKAFDDRLPIRFASADDVPALSAHLAEALRIGNAGRSLLTPEYTLEYAAAAYLDLLRAGPRR